MSRVGKSSGRRGAPGKSRAKRISEGAQSDSLQRPIKPHPHEPPELDTRRRATAVLGVSVRTFADLEAAGTVVAARRGRGGRPSLYDLAVIVPAYLAHLGQARPTGNDREARARRDSAQGELVELTIAERRRHLLPRAQVVLEGQAFVKALQAKLRALPRRLAQAGLVARGDESKVVALVHEALSEISRWSSMLDLLKAQRVS